MLSFSTFFIIMFSDVTHASTRRAARCTVAPDPNTTIRPTVLRRMTSTVRSTVATMAHRTSTTARGDRSDAVALARRNRHHRHHATTIRATRPSTTPRKATKSPKPSAIATMGRAETMEVSKGGKTKKVPFLGMKIREKTLAQECQS